MAKSGLLYLVAEKFANIDLHPVSNAKMGPVFEELIRKFAELSNETAGKHFAEVVSKENWAIAWFAFSASS